MHTRNCREKFDIDTNSLVMMGLLTALEIVLSRFVSISTWNIKIGFAFVPLAIAAIKLGPIRAGVVGALADFLGATLFPIGPFFPGFTLTSFLNGATLGGCLHKKQTFSRIIIAVAINQIILSLFLNTLWISIVSGTPYKALFITRIMQCVIIAPIEVITINLIYKTTATRLAVVNNRR